MKTDDYSSKESEDLSREEISDDRREFLKKCGKIAAYAVLVTPAYAIVSFRESSSGASEKSHTQVAAACIGQGCNSACETGCTTCISGCCTSGGCPVSCVGCTATCQDWAHKR
jgi:hypothetical protein